MIGTGCEGKKIEDLPSRTHPLPAPYLHPLPFGGSFKNVSFNAAPCTRLVHHVAKKLINLLHFTIQTTYYHNLKKSAAFGGTV